MAKKGLSSTAGVGSRKGDLESVVRAAGARGIPPVHLWTPPYCGELDLRIAADGTWCYQGTPIGRPALVKLFASVLKVEDGRHYLVTPVEKCGIVVEDAPLLAVAMSMDRDETGQHLHFRTNTDDEVNCGPDHALRFEPEEGTGGLKPYLHVRHGLWAKVTRALFYDLVALGEERTVAGVRMFGVASGGMFFAMAPADTLEDNAADQAPIQTGPKRNTKA